MPAELTIFRRIYLFVQAGLGNFRRVDKVIQEFFLGDVEHLQGDVFPEVGAIHQQLEATPGGFHFLKSLVVENFIHLGRQPAVNLRNHVIHSGLADFFSLMRRFEHFLNKGADSQPGRLVSIIVRSQGRLADD